MSDEEVQAPVRPVNVNTGAVADLRDGVSGIGQVLAERIVAYREAHGAFAALSDVTGVAGIGPNLLAQIADQLTVGEAPEASEPSEPQAEEAVGERVEELVWDAAVSEPQAEEPVEPQAMLGEEEEDILEEPPMEGEELVEEPAWDAEAEVIAEVPEDEETMVPAVEPVSSEEASAEESGEEELEEEVGEAAEEEAIEMVCAVPAPAVAEQPLGETRSPQEDRKAPLVGVTGGDAGKRGDGRPSFWRSFWLVLLGGLVGVVLTLVGAIIWSGTVDFAPRREVDALSRNVNTMQQNHDLTWQRVDQLAARVGQLEQDMAQVGALTKRVSALEGELAASQDALADAEKALDQLFEDLSALRGDVSKSVTELEGRADASEQALNKLNAAFAELQKGFERVQDRVASFDAFFSAMRDLLNEMQGPVGGPTPTKAP